MIRNFIIMMLSLSVCMGASAADSDKLNINNVVVVLDASGSMISKMRGTNTIKMKAAKDALSEVLKQIPADTNIGLLVFSSNNRTQPWVYPLGPRNEAVFIRALQKISAGGGTPLGEYIKKGADRLLAQRNKQHGYGTYRLLVVTDGEANDKHLVDMYTPEVIARGITVDVIGVDMQAKHTLATKVHSYRRADDPKSLKQAIVDVFAEVKSSGGQDASEDVFAELQAIPDEAAAAMLSSLASSGNHPIGKQPGSVAVVQEKPAPKTAVKVVTPKSSTTVADDSGSWMGTLIVAVIIFVVVMKVVIAAVRSS